MKKARNDEEFVESLAYVFVTAILEQDSLRDSVLLPLMEYLESSATVKAFLETPFLSVEVPSGGGPLKCKLVLHDLLGHQCGKPLFIRTFIDSKQEDLVKLKDIIRFIEND